MKRRESLMIPTIQVQASEVSFANAPGRAEPLMASMERLDIGVGLLPLLTMCDRWDIGGLSTTHHPDTNGAHVFIYDAFPGGIGIADLGQPDWGDPVEVSEGEVPVYWACGVTPQNVLREARVPFCITHAPGHMLVADDRVRVSVEGSRLIAASPEAIRAALR